MSNFIHPPKINIENTRYNTHKNQAVNLDNVYTVSISRENYYPDSEGIPVILFVFQGYSHSWYFEKGEDKLVEKTYKIITNYREKK